MHFYLIGLVSNPAQKTSGARHAFEVNLFGSPNSISRSGVGLRGPRALGLVFGKRFLFGAYGLDIDLKYL